jgi:hypothetical protein
VDLDTLRCNRYTGASYVNLDTQFQVVDANLFAQLVDLKDQYAAASKDAAATSSITANSALFLASKSYADLFKDIRRCVDLCHRDGIIKDQVALDPAKYIVPDPNLFPMLQQFQLSGKKVFLLTNSFYDYTDVAMTFLLQEHRKAQAMAAAVTGDSIRDPEPSSWAARGEWVQYFDLVVVGSCKPAYMLDPYLSMFRVETPADVAAASAAAVAGAGDELPRGAMSPPLSDRGYCGGSEYWLRNTDGVGLDPDAFLAQGRVFQGGNWQHLHDMLGVAQGDQVLYVGDHTYRFVFGANQLGRPKTETACRCVFCALVAHASRTYCCALVRAWQVMHACVVLPPEPLFRCCVRGLRVSSVALDCGPTATFCGRSGRWGGARAW